MHDDTREYVTKAREGKVGVEVGGEGGEGRNVMTAETHRTWAARFVITKRYGTYAKDTKVYDTLHLLSRLTR